MADYDLIDVPGMDRKSYVLLDDGTYAKKVSMYGFDSDININSESNSVSTSGLVGKPTGGNGDFVTAYTAATQITFSSLPSFITNINTEDIISIFQINASGAVVKTYFRSDETITVAANVATIVGATFGATDTFVVFTSIERQNDVVDITGVYNATEPSLSDGEKAQLQLNEAGELKVTGGAGASSVSAEFVSPSDFTATYTSSSTITLSGVPFSVTNSSQVAYIKQVKSDNTSRTYVNGANDITLLISSNVITVYEKGVVVTSLASGDVYEVGLNSQRKAYDASTNSTMVSPLKNVWNQYTDVETLVTAQDLTASYADFGAEIDMRGYTHLRVAIVTDVNDSENVTLKLLGLNSLGGSDEYEIEGGTTQALWTTSASDSKISYTFDVKGTPVIQLQAIAGTLGATAGDLTISISKIWRGN